MFQEKWDNVLFDPLPSFSGFEFFFPFQCFSFGLEELDMYYDPRSVPGGKSLFGKVVMGMEPID
jgi:hypothetical protein